MRTFQFMAKEFLSTLPARGATRPVPQQQIQPMGISIHAPREGSDPSRTAPDRSCEKFLSTLPARGATRSIRGLDASLSISIHAPREGSDPNRYFQLSRFQTNFYPRSPRGERQNTV